jgi:DNA-binding NtrC family response regulator
MTYRRLPRGTLERRQIFWVLGVKAITDPADPCLTVMEVYEIIWICDPGRVRESGTAPPPAWNVQFLDPAAALSILPSMECAVVVLELPVPGWTPGRLVEALQTLVPDVPIFVRDPTASPISAIGVAQSGTVNFLSCDDDAFQALEAVIEASRAGDLARLASGVADAPWERFLVGRSREMRQVSQIIRLVGSRRATVLITGETGTGKELAARALHLAGVRGSGPLVAVNCSALPETLLESELFGHVRGAFTGAWQGHTGRFEQANGGTIFLDEIGELPVDLQSKLLRVLQEREVQRLGSSENIKLDVRVVAATNCDLLERVERGEFREDLYYRLNVVPLHMPPLRSRTGDISLLARHFVEKVCRAEGLPLKQLTAEAEARLCEYSWPGNVRQLENAIETAVALSGSRSLLIPLDFTALTAARLRVLPITAPVVAVPAGGLDYERTLAGIEKSILEQALRMTGGNKKAAADMLRLKRTTLSAKVRSLAFG